jgi:hypothetical protein
VTSWTPSVAIPRVISRGSNPLDATHWIHSRGVEPPRDAPTLSRRGVQPLQVTRDSSDRLGRLVSPPNTQLCCSRIENERLLLERYARRIEVALASIILLASAATNAIDASRRCIRQHPPRSLRHLTVDRLPSQRALFQRKMSSSKE